MKQAIKDQVAASFEAGNLLEAQAEAGMIIRLSAGNFILVITTDRHSGNSFYYVPCYRDGRIKRYKWQQNCSAANLINNSVMLCLGDRALQAEIIDQIQLQKFVVFHNCRRYEWHLTGDAAVDSYMSNLDERYSLFVDTCSDLQRRIYSQQEDRNHHSENGSFVEMHANYFRATKLAKLKGK